MGFIRNLTEEEIIDQIIYWNHKLYPKYVGRIAFMGMGEPFLNWDNLIVALNLIRSKNGLNLGSRKISISTAGIVPRIYDFADLNTEINLAISLHSAIQSTRESLMPIAQKYPLSDLTKSLYYYTQKTHRQLFWNMPRLPILMILKRKLMLLLNFSSPINYFFLNLIPLNPVKGGLIPSSKINKIEKQLKESGVDYSLRHSLGQSINSACGQLATAS